MKRLDDAIREYRARRQARLDAKAVEKFRKRRQDRLAYRFDDEENENNEGKHKGHGNTHIPFGLCQREGISIGKDWTPEDAWKALEGKGYTADTVYKRLKETGKVAPARKKVTKITEQHFPEFMRTKALKKSVSVIASFVSEQCDDGNITELIGAAVGTGGKVPPKVTCKRSSGDGAYVRTKYDSKTKVPVSSEIVVPMFTDKTNDVNKEQKIRDFCHEWTHYLDMIGRDEDGYGHFSSSVASLRDAVAADDGSVGEEARKIFAEFKARSDGMDRERGQRIVNFPKELAREKYGDDWPEWITRTGYVDEYKAWKVGQREEAHKHVLALKRRQKEIFAEYAERKRRAMNGVTNLQGIYDAIYGGKDKEKRGIIYGHKERYYSKDPSSRVGEAIADYVALKATNPKLAAVFAKDKPKIAAELDKAIEGLAKRLRG